VRTSRGEEKVIANDIFRERVTLRGVEGEMRTIQLAELRGEMTAAGDVLASALETAAEERPVVPASPDGEELIELTELAPPVARSRQERPPRASQPPREEKRPARPPRAAEVPTAPANASTSASKPQTEPAQGATAMVTQVRVDGPALTPVVGDAAPTDERRTQRRRGRRGGRRNRPGGGGSPREGDDGSDSSNGAS
jgi:hypothetical protein